MPRRLKWWQVRTTEFALFLYAVIVQRALVLGLFVVIAALQDSDHKYKNEAVYLDDFLFWDLPQYFNVLFAAIWFLFALSLLSALLERCYGHLKFALVFVVLAVSIALSHRVAWVMFGSITQTSGHSSIADPVIERPLG